jgi:mono/diheme cytochrome c family protein
MKSALETASPWARLTIVVAAFGSIVPAWSAETNPIYDSHCAMCHQRGGVGLKGTFPRLAGRVDEIGRTEDGRRFLIEVTLFGMAGKIDVDGAPVIGVMPSFSVLKDEDLATVLNYVMSLEAPEKSKAKGRPVNIEAADVAKVRAGVALNATQVLANRASVVP